MQGNWRHWRDGVAITHIALGQFGQGISPLQLLVYCSVQVDHLLHGNVTEQESKSLLEEGDREVLIQILNLQVVHFVQDLDDNVSGNVIGLIGKLYENQKI